MLPTQKSSGSVVATTLTRSYILPLSHVDRSLDAPLLAVRTNVLGTATVLQQAKSAWRDRNDVRFLHVVPMRYLVLRHRRKHSRKNLLTGQIARMRPASWQRSSRARLVSELWPTGNYWPFL